MAYFWDALAIVAYFALVIGVGLASARHRGDNMREFSVGSRQLPWWAVLASIVAAELSAATFLGTPAEGYHGRNFLYAQLAIGTVIARIIVAYLFIRPFYDNNVVSIYEFLQIRFGVATRNAASAVFLITRLLASGTRLYVAAVIVVVGYEMIHGVAATNEQAVWIYGGAVVLVTALTTLYTAAGGIRAVVWTDVIQATVMGGAVIYALVSLWLGVGGWAGAHSVLNQPGDLQDFRQRASRSPRPRLQASSMSLNGHPILGAISGILGNEYTIWAALLGSVFTTMATHGTDQDMVQRMLTAKDHHKARLALVLSGLVDIPVAMGFLFIGILIYVFYQLHPDPHLPTKNPEIFSYYILHQLPPGARGLLIAGVLATAMGSLSTALNALATSFTAGFLGALFGAGSRSASHRPRGALEHGGLRVAARRGRHDHGGRRGLFAPRADHSGRARHLRLHLRLAPRHFPARPDDQKSRHRARQSHRHGLRFHRRRDLERPAVGLDQRRARPELRHRLRRHLARRSTAFSTFKDGYVQPPVWLVQIEFPWRVMFGTLTTYAVAWCFRNKQ